MTHKVEWLKKTPYSNTCSLWLISIIPTSFPFILEALSTYNFQTGSITSDFINVFYSAESSIVEVGWSGVSMCSVKQHLTMTFAKAWPFIVR